MNLEFRPEYKVEVDTASSAQSSPSTLSVTRWAPPYSASEWGIYNHFEATSPTVGDEKGYKDTDLINNPHRSGRGCQTEFGYQSKFLQIILVSYLNYPKIQELNFLEGDLFHSIKWLGDFPFLQERSLEKTHFSEFASEGPPADFLLF